MKKSFLILSLLSVFIITTGCHSVMFHTHPRLVITNRKVVTEPEYRETEYEDTGYEEDTYEDEYYEEDYVDDVDRSQTYSTRVETSLEFYVGTSIWIEGIHCHWCDYCWMWHPRCLFNHCYCASSIVRHYGYYNHGIYIDHCHHWHYQPHYRPVISTYRFRSGNRYIRYSVNDRKRNFTKRTVTGVSKNRVRYRGKEKIDFTYAGNKKQVSRTGRTSDRNSALNKKTEKARSSSDNLSKRTLEKSTKKSLSTREALKRRSKDKSTNERSVSKSSSRSKSSARIKSNSARKTQDRKSSVRKSTPKKKNSFLKKAGNLFKKARSSSSSSKSKGSSVKRSTSKKAPKAAKKPTRSTKRKKKKGGG